MSFDMTRLRRYPSEHFPGEEMTPQEIKDLKDGVPNYPMPEIKRQEYPHEWLCGECTGSGVMLGFYPCKVCGGNGYVVPEQSDESIDEYMNNFLKSDIKQAFNDLVAYGRAVVKMPYPNERELALLNNRIATLKAQLSKELQKKKSERSQRDINQLQQSINTLTKWKTQKK